MINRRQLLKTSLGFTALTLLPLSSFAVEQAIDFELAVSYQDEYWFEQPTKTMAFSMPELRIIQGQRVRIRVTNNLEVDTSVHWHGIRLNNAMDGVTGLTQAPIKPNESFIYDFVAPDAGSYWFHSHHNSLEQIAKGLYGALIVEPAVSLNDSVEDLTFLIDDWRINQAFQINSDFDNLRDLSHGGRMGNILTVNRKIGTQSHQLGEQDYLRLRLINVANSRIQQWQIEGVKAQIIAKDGQPLAEFEHLKNTITAGPAERFDVLINRADINKMALASII
jgi:FtsP/CotA-like multicopper oxidase with cupredoxin domain